MLGEKPSRGQGLARDASVLWLTYGFKELGFNRIYARIMSGNYRALASVKKLGFTQEGILRQDYRTDAGFEDIVLLGLLKSEAEALGIYEL
jgi:RimJ/RimL family protein N-acetyltransferase